MSTSSAPWIRVATASTATTSRSGVSASTAAKPASTSCEPLPRARLAMRRRRVAGQPAQRDHGQPERHRRRDKAGVDAHARDQHAGHHRSHAEARALDPVRRHVRGSKLRRRAREQQQQRRLRRVRGRPRDHLHRRQRQHERERRIDRANSPPTTPARGGAQASRARPAASPTRHGAAAPLDTTRTAQRGRARRAMVQGRWPTRCAQPVSSTTSRRSGPPTDGPPGGVIVHWRISAHPAIGVWLTVW
jgi:hypothetical protein